MIIYIKTQDKIVLIDTNLKLSHITYDNCENLICPVNCVKSDSENWWILQGLDKPNAFQVSMLYFKHLVKDNNSFGSESNYNSTESQLVSNQ